LIPKIIHTFAKSLTHSALLSHFAWLSLNSSCEGRPGKYLNWKLGNPTYMMLGYAKPPPNLRPMDYFKLAIPLLRRSVFSRPIR
ncbi:hypothetical protein, partial [Nostoc sp.]|uniref:hypothetical protein n=1 Tax=Nostoc sp. TaxID=1180 RepID=UPI002FF8F023